MTDPAPSRWFIAPYFHVADVVAAADWYRDRLGFQYDRFWGEPPAFCMVWRSGIVIMLSQASDPAAVRPNGDAPGGGDAWDAYVWVEDADALRAEFLGRGVTLAREICDQEYGCRDFDVRDLDGYRLCFGHNTMVG